MDRPKSPSISSSVCPHGHALIRVGAVTLHLEASDLGALRHAIDAAAHRISSCAGRGLTAVPADGSGIH